MSETTARVASLLTTAKATTLAAALRAIPSNVTDTAALVALLATTSSSTETLGGASLALAGDVAYTTAAVAGLLLGSYSAFTAWMIGFLASPKEKGKSIMKDGEATGEFAGLTY